MVFLCHYHKAFPFADDDGTLDVEVVPVRESEGLEVGEENLVGDAPSGRPVDDLLLGILEDGGVQAAAIRVQQILVGLVRTVVNAARCEPAI